MKKTALTEEIALKALFATKTLLSTKKKGSITQVWKGSQYLGDFSKEEGSVKACRYGGEGLTAFKQKIFQNEADALDWITESKD